MGKLADEERILGSSVSDAIEKSAALAVTTLHSMLASLGARFHSSSGGFRSLILLEQLHPKPPLLAFSQENWEILDLHISAEGWLFSSSRTSSVEANFADFFLNIKRILVSARAIIAANASQETPPKSARVLRLLMISSCHFLHQQTSAIPARFRSGAGSSWPAFWLHGIYYYYYLLCWIIILLMMGLMPLLGSPILSSKLSSSPQFKLLLPAKKFSNLFNFLLFFAKFIFRTLPGFVVIFPIDRRTRKNPVATRIWHLDGPKDTNNSRDTPFEGKLNLSFINYLYLPNPPLRFSSSNDPKIKSLIINHNLSALSLNLRFSEYLAMAAAALFYVSLARPSAPIASLSPKLFPSKPLTHKLQLLSFRPTHQALRPRFSTTVCSYSSGNRPDPKGSGSNCPIFRRWSVPWNWQTISLTSLACGFRKTNRFLGSFVLTGLIETAAIPYTGIQVEELSLDEKAEILFLDQAITTAIVLGVLYTLTKSSNPLPNDIYCYDWREPFNLQRGWLLWAAIGLAGALAAIALTGVAMSSLNSEPPTRETDALVRLLPLIGSSNIRLPSPLAVLLSAAVFSAAHLTPGEFPQLFVLGTALGFSYAQTRNLLTPITIHAFWNSGVILLLTFLQTFSILGLYVFSASRRNGYNKSFVRAVKLTGYWGSGEATMFFSDWVISKEKMVLFFNVLYSCVIQALMINLQPFPILSFAKHNINANQKDVRLKNVLGSPRLQEQN
nr:putative CAAX aminoterminal protease [Ipomoea batatas]